MTQDTSDSQAITRLPSGIPGLDTILQGGFWRGGIYIIMGVPGVGKTILANQMCFAHVAGGGHAVYVSLLSETHGRMLAHLRPLSFFDPNQVSSTLYYISGYTDLQEQGLRGLIDMIRTTVRARQATLVVIDGLATVSDLAFSELDFKRFIQELQVYLETMGCTVLLLTQPGSQHPPPEHTMVDGIIQLTLYRAGMRAVRELEVLKLRGSNYMGGGHFFDITGAGIAVYPRTEALLTGEPPPQPLDLPPLQVGVAGLDAMLGGGVGQRSTTLLLGASGSGKTLLGLHFLAAGGRIGEPGLHFCCYEIPTRLIGKANNVGLDIGTLVDQGMVEIIWQSAVEQYLDALAERLLAAVARRKVCRLVIDGFDALLTASVYPERLHGFLTTLTNELQARGVTTMITVELRDLLGSEIDLSITGVSALVDNILLLRHVDVQSQIYRTLSVIKMRDSPYDTVVRTLAITTDGVSVGVPFAAIVGAGNSHTRRGPGARLSRRQRPSGR